MCDPSLLCTHIPHQFNGWILHRFRWPHWKKVRNSLKCEITWWKFKCKLVIFLKSQVKRLRTNTLQPVQFSFSIEFTCELQTKNVHVNHFGMPFSALGWFLRVWCLVAALLFRSRKAFISLNQQQVWKTLMRSKSSNSFQVNWNRPLAKWTPNFSLKVG